jgi:myo-inositol 2-dehydrogenase/D-chiro-inositol 1-dehydrogenase
MDTGPLRVAIVGLGRMGGVHLRALARCERVAVTAVVDTAPAARERAGGLPCFDSVEDLLAAGVADAALVAAPTPLHLGIVTTFLEAGVPVLCEKPLGRSPEEARAAGRVAERTGVPLAVAYWRRFVPELVRLRERIGVGELGEISLIGCWQWDAEPPTEAFRTASGGIGIDMGVHEFDQIGWLTGQRMARVTPMAAALPSAPAVGGDPDSVALLTALSGGGVGLVSLGRRFPHGDCCWVEVWGTLGHAREEFLWGADADAALDRALAAQADAFAERVRTGAVTGATAADAVAALELAVQVA